MESLRSIVDNANFPDGKCFCYGFKYLNNETNRVSVHYGGTHKFLYIGTHKVINFLFVPSGKFRDFSGVVIF